ncbi:dihydrodipicolinate reductase [Mycobacterium sp.]|uniref:NAD(P)H-dependent amine dehydrogenase family protein n=2 Tax=Mycobacterium sp. TaxID=1785 RepID=UPI003BB696B9
MSREPLDHPEQLYKVVVWATGRVGRLAIRAVADRPNLELVGVWVHSESKDGQDAGAIAGIDPLSVAATRDDAAILAGDADCIIYTGPATSRPREAITDFCRILESGKNIVTTSVPGLVFPRGSIKQSTVQRIVESAIKGGSSIYSSGIEPGFGCDLLAVAMASMSNRIYSIRGLEITDYSRDNTVYEMRELFGFGQPMDYQGGIMMPGVIKYGWGAAVTMVAEALGVQLDEIRETCEFAPSPRRLETLSGVIEPGTVAAVWFRCVGVVDGHEVITIEHVDRMAEDVAPDWPKSRAGGIDGVWRVMIEGEPSFDAEFETGFNSDEDSTDHGLLATGMRAINAVPWVCHAAPGLVDALHIPLTPAIGSLRPRRDGIPTIEGHHDARIGA